jgi:tRNA (guanine-N7-)-methyltransferase
MRVKFNPSAHNSLSKSNYVINDFPHKINHTTIIELGMGKGAMLAKLAQKYPNSNFIGIEKNETVAHHAMILFEQMNLKNVKIIAKDIKELPILLKGKVSELYITFPDP